MSGDAEIKVNITGNSHGGVVAVDDMRAELARLNAEVAQLSAHQAAFAGGGDSFAQSLSQMGLSFGTLGFQVGGLNVNLGAMLSQMGVLGEVAGPAGLAVAMIGGIGSQVMSVAEGFEQAADRALQFAEALAGQAMQQGLQYVEQLTQQMFQLNQTSENTLFAWGFIFGNMQQQGSGPNAPFVDVSGNSQQIYDWAQKYSMQIPFTRFDEMAAISSMAQIHGDEAGNPLTPQQVEQYLPVIADLAATKGKAAYGGQGLTLQQAAYAILEASFGRTIMLKRDLFINPDDLVKYGLDADSTGTGVHINDVSTLLPALQKYAEAHHLTGAAGAAAHQTFSGEWSSAVDRFQLFEQSAGTDMFKGLKSDLEAVTSWYDAHKDAIDHFTSAIGKIAGGAVTGGGQLLGGAFDALDKSGIAADLMKQLTRFGTWLNDPQTQKALHDFGDLIGNVVAPGLKDAGTFLDALATGIGATGIGQDILGTLSELAHLLKDPETQKMLAAFGDAFGKIAGSGAKDAFDALKNLLSGLGSSGAGETLLKDLQSIGNWLSDPKHQDDIQKFAYTVGIFLGDEFVVASDAVKMLIDDLSILAQLIAKEGDAFDALRHGDVGRLAHDSGDIVAILKQLQTTSDADAQKIGADERKIIQDFLQGKPTANTFALTGPIGAQRAHDAAVAAGTASPSTGAQDGYSSGFSDLGSQNAIDYLTGFHATIRDQTGPDLVQAFTDGVNRQLSGSSGAGDILAQRLATFIDNRTRQAIADALATMDLTSAGSRTQAGGPGHQPFTP